MGIKDENSRSTPVVKLSLGKNDEGKCREDDSFHCRLTALILQFLAIYSRLDVSMATHQVAKFSNNPKACYDAAIKIISKYLLGTSDAGLNRKPKEDRDLETFSDADFAYGFDEKTTEDPMSTHSRVGFVIKHTGCPIE